MPKYVPKNQSKNKEVNMIDISKISLTLSQFANGGPVIATSISPINPFRDGHSVTEEVVGRKITVVFPDNGYETQ